MERDEALKKLKELIGQDLRKLADARGITVWRAGRLNKGWAGLVVESYLGLPANSSKNPNFGSWELKLVSLRQKGDLVTVKETMAICMINPEDVARKCFEDSHLYSKLRRLVVVARLVQDRKETKSLVYGVRTFDLDHDKELFEAVKADYEEIRQVLKTRGFEHLTGKMGRLIQPRTKGPGHGSTSRAFYARKALIERIFGLGRSAAR